MEEMEDVKYTKADLDRAISKIHEDLELQYNKRVADMEVVAEAEAKRKFSLEFKDLDNLKKELHEQMLEDNRKLSEELNSKKQRVK